MKKVLILCMVGINSIHGFSQRHDTIRVYFQLDDSRINKKAAKFIDSLVTGKVFTKKEKLTVLGYADYLGSNAYNDTLSYTRARNVAAQLVNAGILKENIAVCVGKGKIERPSMHGEKGFAADRNVQIIRGWDASTANLHGDTTLITDVSTIKVNAVYPLNILFENARSVILPESLPEMKKVYNFLNDNKTITVLIEGHICCRDPMIRTWDGVDFDNGGRLSLTRAKAIYDYLITKGIDKSRLKYVGLGNTKPFVNPEVTEDDKKQNRRVDIRILSK